MTKAKRIGFAIGAIAVMTVCLTACPVTSHQAADAANKYVTALTAVVDTELKLHATMKADGTPIIGDEMHFQILHAEQIAVKAGHDLDAAVLVADKGGDTMAYIGVAQSSFDELVAMIQRDPVASQQLQLLVNTASDALRNAISLIQALKNKTPAPATSSNHHALGWSLASLMLVGFAATGGGSPGSSIPFGGILSLLNLILQLEPTAFDLILRLATSLKGKSTAEIVALNEGMLNDLDAKIAAELAKEPKKA